MIRFMRNSNISHSPPLRTTIIGRLLLFASITLMLICVPLADASRGPSDQGIAGWKRVTWTMAQGAPSQITSLAQTSDGYLWIGSAVGLFRFDGMTFARIDLPPAGRDQSDSIASLAATRDGGLWVGHEWGGASLISGGRQRAITPLALGNQMFRIQQDETGAIWTISAGPDGLVVGRREHGRWAVQTLRGYHEYDLASATVGQREQWIIGGRRLWRIRFGDGSFSTSTRPVATGSTLATDASGTVWLVDPARGLTTLSKTSPSRASGAEAIRLDGRSGTSSLVAFDGREGLWRLSRANGVERFVLRASPGRELGVRRAGRAPLLGATTPFVQAALRDREGNLWIGGDAGLDQFKRVAFTTADLPSGSEHDIYPPQAMLRDGRGHLFLKVGRYVYQADGVGDPARLPGRLLENDVPCPSPSGGIWVRSDERHLLLKGGGRSEVRDLPPTSSLLAFKVHCLEDAHGRIWSPGLAGRFGYLSNGRTYAAPPTKDSDAHVYNLALDFRGDVIVYHARRSLWTFRNQDAGMHELLNGSAIAIGFVEFIYNDSRYMFIGGPRGLMRLDGSRFALLPRSRFPYLNGLSGMVRSRRGETWIQNDHELVRMRSADLDRAFADSGYNPHVTIFDADDGLPGTSAYFNYSTVAEDSRGRIWVVTNNGLAFTDANILRGNPLPPPVLITSLQSGYSSYAPAAGLKLSSGTSRIAIGYAALSLTTAAKNKYRYRLGGVDPDWIDAGSQRRAVYTNLGPGTYVFEVLGSNNAGVWARQPARLQFTIPATFVQSGTFKALCALLACLVLLAVHHVRLLQLQRRARERQGAEQSERERIARELHDTLLQGVQVLTLRFQAAADRLPAAEPAKDALSSALQKADDVIAETIKRVRELRYGVDDLDLPGLLRKVKTESDLDAVSIHLGMSGKERPVRSPVVGEISRIVGEAQANIRKHAHADNVWIDVAFEPAALRLTIEDDGVGLPADVSDRLSASGHFGILGMHERARTIRGTLALERRAPNGTRVLLTVPGSTAYPSLRRELMSRFETVRSSRGRARSSMGTRKPG